MNNITKTLYVFPTSRAIRQYIQEEKSINTFLPKTISIGDLFSNVVVNTNKTLISKDLRILYLKEAILSIDIKKLGLNSSFSKFYVQSEYIFKFFNELNNEFKNIDDLNNSDTYAFYLEHLDLLNKIYKKYCFILEKNNFIDTCILPRDYELNKDYISDFTKMIVFYEGYFSSFEFDIINQLSKIIPLEINLITNQFNTKNISMFKKINLDLEINYKYELDISSSKILKKQKCEIDLTNHKIYPIKQRITQIAFIKYALTNMIKNGIDASNIVVVLPDEKFSSYLKLFDDENYFNFAMGNDIKSSKTYILAHSINNYINKSEQKNKKRLEYFDLNIGFIDDNIKSFWNKKVQKEIFFKIIDFIYKDETSAEILEYVLQIKLSMNILFFSNNIKNLKNEIKLKDAYKIFLSKINEITLNDTLSGKITVIGILESRYVNFDGVIVIDFNDNIVPKLSIKDKFISTRVKENSKLPTLKHREDLQKYYYKRLFDNAKQIYISYVSDDSNTPSRFLKQLFEKQNIINADFSKVMNIRNNTKLYNEDIYMDINLSLQEWSATSLKTYLQCKRMYYFNYILKLKEHDISLKPASYEIGQIIHNILHKIYESNNISYDNLCKEMYKYQNQNPYLSLELEIWKKKLSKFTIQEQIRFNQDKVTVYALEMPFKMQYNNITIKGTIDRIDKLKDNTYAILDYKTSKNLKIDTSKTIQNTTNFQLEFYAIARKDLNVSKVAYYDLNDGSIKEEILINEKIKLLDDIFKSLNTKRVNFSKCEDKKTCTFCIYKTICGED